jgi:hypothetical protein
VAAHRADAANKSAQAAKAAQNDRPPGDNARAVRINRVTIPRMSI